MTTQQRGFTLLEMMVALALFAVIGLTGFQILQGVLRSGEISREHSDRLSATQHVFSLLEQDISQALEPPLPATARGPHPGAAEQTAPVTAATLADSPAASSPVLRLLRRNWLNPAAVLPRSSLEWVQWQIGDHGLQRQSVAWQGDAAGQTRQPEGSRAESVQPRTTAFPQVSDLRLRYWQNGRWLTGWFAAHALPQAIEVTLTTDGYGELQRVFFITGAQ